MSATHLFAKWASVFRIVWSSVFEGIGILAAFALGALFGTTGAVFGVYLLAVPFQLL